MSEICPHCGQPIKEAHKEVLNKMKLTMLQIAGRHVQQTLTNDFMLRDFTAPKEAERPVWSNFQKLRYHGLVAKVKDKQTDRVVKGRWLITRNGWAFLRGDIELPKFVLVRNNHIVPDSHSKQLIGIRDVYRGSDVIQTTFEYFDDAGRMVGVRPVAPSKPQNASLF